MAERKKLSHVDARGKAQMVNIGAKPPTRRRAVAEGYVLLLPSTLRAIADQKVPKGEVLGVARVAGIMAAKRCDELIPLCHGLPLESVEVDFDLPEATPEPGRDRVRLRVKAIASLTAQTGVEMEALAAVTIAALTIYDMCKAIDKGIRIDGIRLLEKTGGRGGAWLASDLSK